MLKDSSDILGEILASNEGKNGDSGQLYLRYLVNTHREHEQNIYLTENELNVVDVVPVH